MDGWLGDDGALGGGTELGEDVDGGCVGGGVELWGLWQPCSHRIKAMPKILGWYLLVTLLPLEAVMRYMAC